MANTSTGSVWNALSLEPGKRMYYPYPVRRLCIAAEMVENGGDGGDGGV